VRTKPSWSDLASSLPAAHIAEETKNPSVAAARGVFWSCASSAVLGFVSVLGLARRDLRSVLTLPLPSLFIQPLLLLFLFCSPSLDTLYTLAAPQPLVLLFQLSLGTGGQIVLTLIAITGLLIVSRFSRAGVNLACAPLIASLFFSVQNMSICIVAASRLVSAIARDGILPGSEWIGRVDKNGQPRNAVIFIGGVSSKWERLV
jgi:amino acid transporter